MKGKQLGLDCTQGGIPRLFPSMPDQPEDTKINYILLPDIISNYKCKLQCHKVVAWPNPKQVNL